MIDIWIHKTDVTNLQKSLSYKNDLFRKNRNVTKIDYVQSCKASKINHDDMVRQFLLEQCSSSSLANHYGAILFVHQYCP